MSGTTGRWTRIAAALLMSRSAFARLRPRRLAWNARVSLPGMRWNWKGITRKKHNLFGIGGASDVKGFQMSPPIHDPKSVRSASKNAEQRICLEVGIYSWVRRQYDDQHLVPGLYFTSVPLNFQPVRYEVARVRTLGGTQDRILLHVPRDAAPSPLEPRFPSPLFQLSEPSKTECDTLRRAIADAEALRARGWVPSLRLLVGDLLLPIELRGLGERLLPPSYRELLARHTFEDVEIIREGRCQNTGAKHIIGKLKRIYPQTDAPDSIAAVSEGYAETGWGIARMQTAGGHRMYLAADVLLDRRVADQPMISLVREDKRPSCATTYAGCLLRFTEKNVGRLVIYCDLADDADIQRKLTEGAIIAALMKPEAEMEIDLVVLNQSADYDRSRISFSDFRSRGRRASFSAMMSEAVSRMRTCNVDFMTDAPLSVSETRPEA